MMYAVKACNAHVRDFPMAEEVSSHQISSASIIFIPISLSASSSE